MYSTYHSMLYIDACGCASSFIFLALNSCIDRHGIGSFNINFNGNISGSICVTWVWSQCAMISKFQLIHVDSETGCLQIRPFSFKCFSIFVQFTDLVSKYSSIQSNFHLKNNFPRWFFHEEQHQRDNSRKSPIILRISIVAQCHSTIKLTNRSMVLSSYVFTSNAQMHAFKVKFWFSHDPTHATFRKPDA